MTRRALRSLGVWICATTLGGALAQAAGSWEAEIRAAEERHVKAFLAADAPALEEMFSDDFLVNSPLNNVVEKKQLMGMVRSGALKLSEFTQEIEKIQRFGDVVFVMGEDKAVWAPSSPNAGRTDRRRFTDVWRLEGGRWKFIARQATLLCN